MASDADQGTGGERLGSALPGPGSAEPRRAPDRLDARLDRLARQQFRAKFHLHPKELEFVRDRGMDAVRQHARELLSTRLLPAHPHKDGQQTPWAGHPVFVAQHATGTCCRTCLERNHAMARGADLTPAQFDEVIEVIARWVERDARRAGLDPAAGPAPGFGAASGDRRSDAADEPPVAPTLPGL